jgi:hypothetical protein
MSKPLDQETFQHVTQVIDRARRNGANIPTRLNDAKLIWTKQRERNARVETVEQLIMEFQVWKPHEVLRIINRELINCTPADMHQAISLWLDKYLTHLRS